MGTNRKKQAKMGHTKLSKTHPGQDEGVKVVKVYDGHAVVSLIGGKTKCGKNINGWHFAEPSYINCEICNG